MRGLIEATLNNGPSVLLNPHAIEWARPNTEGNAFISMMGSADHWHLDCTYDDFKLAWANALNFAQETSGSIAGVVEP
jgi:hypothetical protein